MFSRKVSVQSVLALLQKHLASTMSRPTSPILEFDPLEFNSVDTPQHGSPLSTRPTSSALEQGTGDDTPQCETPRSTDERQAKGKGEPAVVIDRGKGKGKCTLRLRDVPDEIHSMLLEIDELQAKFDALHRAFYTFQIHVERWTRRLDSRIIEVAELID